MTIHRGISLRELEQAWTAGGGYVQQRKRTGESRLIHDALGLRSSLYNDRRKDAPLALVQWVQKVGRALAAPPPPILIPSRIPAPPRATVAPDPQPPETMPPTTALPDTKILTAAAVTDALELELRRRGFNGDAPAQAQKWLELVTVRADGSTDVAEVAEIAARDRLRQAQKPKPLPPPVKLEPAPAPAPAPALLSGPEVEKITGRTAAELSKMRKDGKGPGPYQQVGRFFFYDAAAVRAWAAANPKVVAPVVAKAPPPTFLDALTEFIDNAMDADTQRLAMVLRNMLKAGK